MVKIIDSRPWTPEERQECIRLANESFSGSEIAAKLNRKRNSVIGYLHRAGVPLQGHTRNKPVQKKVHIPKPKIIVRPKTPSPKVVAPYVPPPEKPLPEIKPNSRGKYGPTPFIDGRFDQCQWVTHIATNSRPAIICGEAVKRIGCRWCAEHYDIVYIPRSAHKRVIGAMEYGWKGPSVKK